MCGFNLLETGPKCSNQCIYFVSAFKVSPQISLYWFDVPSRNSRYKKAFLFLCLFFDEAFSWTKRDRLP